jgi:hypothetical protein
MMELLAQYGGDMDKMMKDMKEMQKLAKESKYNDVRLALEKAVNTGVETGMTKKMFKAMAMDMWVKAVPTDKIDRKPNAWAVFRSANYDTVKSSNPDKSRKEVESIVAGMYKEQFQTAKEQQTETEQNINGKRPGSQMVNARAKLPRAVKPVIH